jgi:AcrR family transcriptional regulator
MARRRSDNSRSRTPRATRRGRRPATAARGRPRADERDARRDATRTAIVTAALGLFQTKGFDQTTTKAIARKAGVAEGTVFNYFRTKEDIALHFFNEELDHAIAAVRNNPKLKKAPLEEKLFALVHSQFEYLAPYERFIGAAVVHALRPASKLGPLSTSSQLLQLRYVEFVEDLINESLPDGEHSLARMFGPRAFALFYLGMLLYWLHDSSEGKEDTLAFLDRSLTLGVKALFGGSRV